jgi:hypothetical protein
MQELKAYNFLSVALLELVREMFLSYSVLRISEGDFPWQMQHLYMVYFLLNHLQVSIIQNSSTAHILGKTSKLKIYLRAE